MWDILGRVQGRVLKKAKGGYFWTRIGNSSSVHPATCGDEGSPHSGSDHSAAFTRDYPETLGLLQYRVTPLFFRLFNYLATSELVQKPQDQIICKVDMKLMDRIY